LLNFKFVKVDDLNIRYIDLGSTDRRAVLLIHGLGGAIESWRNNMANLVKKEKLRVIALDLPGFGFSDKPRISYTVKFYSDIVAGFAKALCIEPLAVAGSSLGGHVACELAIMHPHIVSKLILISPPGALPKSFKGTSALRRYLKVLKANSIGDVKKALYEVDHKAVEEEYAKVVYNRLAMPGAKDAFLSALNGSSKAPRLDKKRLSKIKVPTLVLWGKEDIMIPARYVEPFAKMKNSRVVLLENCGHRVHADKPTVFNRMVADFVREAG
jgi:2-hydroxy-6-oxonona-2,4-dienedioate hydrolase